MREKLTITKNPKEILEKITEIHGIDIIKQFIKDYNKQNRNKQKRGNKKLDVAYDFYKLRFVNGYSYTAAIRKVANDKNISENTVREHCRTINRLADNEDYYSFGYVVDEWSIHNGDYYNNIEEIIKELAQRNSIPDKKAMIFYYKYKLYDKPNKPEINAWKFSGQDIPF